ncbi:MAG: hypothetical protein ACTHN5_15885 [Phycisphaerae bacterium]
MLIEPPLAPLAASLRSPLRIQSTVFGRSLAELHAAARRHLLEQAAKWAGITGVPAPEERTLQNPLVLTGHQVEFYHAGVWAKVLVADELARRTGAAAFDVLVDHDVIDELGFDVPVQQGNAAADGAWKREAVQWAQADAVAADGLTAPTPGAFEKWDAELAKHPLAHTDSLAFFLTALQTKHAELPYTQWLSRARSDFERAMGLQVHHLPTSLLCSGELWKLFVRAWAQHAADWVPLYNKHLGAYRKSQGIKNSQHPMPDLAMRPEEVELPFWTYVPGNPRERLVVRPGSDPFASLAQDAVIRPRALALTMFLRLFFADLFIHGIGGALYDQITDGILHELVGAAPAYGCVSAAWLLPLGQPLDNLDDIAALKWRRHHAAHNPQLAIDPFTALRTDVAEAVRDRRDLIAQIAHSLQTHRRDPAAIQQRRDWFRKLHALNQELHGKAPRVLANLDRQIADARRAAEQNKVLLWREYFFALHSMESLHKLIATIRSR